VKNGWKTRSRTDSGNPGPLSLMTIVHVDASPSTLESTAIAGAGLGSLI